MRGQVQALRRHAQGVDFDGSELTTRREMLKDSEAELARALAKRDGLRVAVYELARATGASADGAAALLGMSRATVWRKFGI